MVIANLFNGVAYNLLNIDGSMGRDFSCDNSDAGFNQAFTGNLAPRVLQENSIQNGVGYLVRHFIGMPFGNGFGGKQVIVQSEATYLEVLFLS